MADNSTGATLSAYLKAHRASLRGEHLHVDRLSLDEIIAELDSLQAQVEVLKSVLSEYLGEYDTPAKDYLYRNLCRERLREALTQVQQSSDGERK